MNSQAAPDNAQPSRRDFLKATSIATGAAAAAWARPAAAYAFAGGSDVLKVGLVGCGNRGRGAAAHALSADPNTKLVALGDLFPESIEKSVANLAGDKEFGDRVDVPPERRFVGIDAYKGVIDACDVVLLAAPPHFRPAHFEAAVAAGKHIFTEKPIAVDAPGVRRTVAACEEAKRKGLAVTSGLNWRYDLGAREAIAKVHAGDIGEVVAIQSSFCVGLPGKPWPMVRREGWSEMEFQIRNWYWFTWLSGDHIVEQAIHSLDKGQWALHDEPPVSAFGLGGLQARSAPDRGQTFDHHAVVFEYANGRRHFHYCRQQVGCTNDVSTHVMGPGGTVHVEGPLMKDPTGKVVWRYRGPKKPSHQYEHIEMFAGLRSGNIRNDGDYMCKSTLLAILGRMATYSGKKVTWEEAWNSQEDLTPPSYEWGPHEVPPVAIPGVTRLG